MTALSLPRACHSQDQPPYRPDLDGLRAIAVLAVVLYHAHVPGAGGGFTGVDVFFVLSGFLITRLLLTELAQKGRVDLLAFWSRRLRRLLPTVLTVLFATTVSGYVLFPAYSRPDLAADTTSALLNFANFNFAGQAVDYFTHEEPPSLLLHFWSLSVEEQFYAVWPVALLALSRVARGSFNAWAAPAFSILAAASFLYSLWVLNQSQPLAFFHTLSRCWQLALGGILAAASLRGWRLPVRAQEPATWLGIGCTTAAILLFSDDLLYPGFYALLPALGSAAIILAGDKGTNPAVITSRVMSSSLLVWVGRRSYAWYLWHWPVMRLCEVLFPAAEIAPFLSLAISLAIAAATYTLIECPVRYGRLSLQPRRYTFTAAGAGVGVLLVAANLILALPRSPAAPDMATRIAAARVDLARNYADGCHLDYDVIDQPPCAYGAPSASRHAVLFGDSHAAQWLTPLADAAAAAGWRLNAWTKSSCPAIDVTIWYRPRRVRFTACDAWREDVLARLTGASKPEIVFISNRSSYDGWIIDRGSDRVLKGRDADAAWRDGFHRVASRLVAAGIHVVLIRDTPAIASGLYDCLEGGEGAACAEPISTALPGHPDLDVAKQFAGRVQILDLTSAICDAAACPMLKGSLIVYQDRHHLTATFARTLAPQFKELLSAHDQNEMHDRRPDSR